jgi:hypothetical protein
MLGEDVNNVLASWLGMAGIMARHGCQEHCGVARGGHCLIDWRWALFRSSLGAMTGFQSLPSIGKAGG